MFRRNVDQHLKSGVTAAPAAALRRQTPPSDQPPPDSPAHTHTHSPRPRAPAGPPACTSPSSDRSPASSSGASPLPSGTTARGSAGRWGCRCPGITASGPLTGQRNVRCVWQVAIRLLAGCWHPAGGQPKAVNHGSAAPLPAASGPLDFAPRFPDKPASLDGPPVRPGSCFEMPPLAGARCPRRGRPPKRRETGAAGRGKDEGRQYVRGSQDRRQAVQGSGGRCAPHRTDCLRHRRQGSVQRGADAGRRQGRSGRAPRQGCRRAGRGDRRGHQGRQGHHLPQAPPEAFQPAHPWPPPEADAAARHRHPRHRSGQVGREGGDRHACGPRRGAQCDTRGRQVAAEKPKKAAKAAAKE